MSNSIQLHTVGRGLTLAVMVGALSACGGGGGGSGGSGSSAPATSANHGTVNLALTDGPGDDFNHVWVTITGIALHTSPDQVWNAGDATWQTFNLPAPVTVDLASLNNGALNNLFSGLSLPAGTYRQIRFFFAGANQALTNSAQGTLDNETPAVPLQWNDQVEYQDSTGAIHEAPLEMAYPVQGMQLLGTFEVAAGSTLNLAVDFDLEESIVPFRHDGQEAFTMRPNLRYFDLNHSGAIVGQLDPTQLCAANALPSNTCAYNLIVHAEILTSDGSRHYASHSTVVDPTTGKFVLYPLALADSTGNPLSYDVVIRGRNLQTLLVTGVPASGTPASGATLLQAAPITPTISATEYTAQFATGLAPLTAGHAIFQETLPANLQANPVPYMIRWRNTDPFTGTFFDPIPLENAPLLVAPFNAGNPLAFASVVPQEGTGGYQVAANENAYYTLGANALMTPPNSGSSQVFTPGTPTLDANVVNGSVAGSIAFSNVGNYDHAELVIARFASIITSTDVSALLATQGGAFSVANLPSGSVAAPLPGAYYYAYLRVWKAGTGMPPRIVPANGFIDLRTSNSVAGFNITANLS